MIRYIHIGAQIKAGNNDFALFDADTGEFLTICGTRIFRSLSHLEDCLLTDGMHPTVVRLTLDLCRDHGKQDTVDTTSPLAEHVRSMRAVVDRYISNFCLLYTSDAADE